MSTILIGTFVVALFILPFFLVGIGKNKEKKHLKDALSKIAEENKCNISISDYWADSAIGLDEHNNHLFFVHTYNGKEMVQHLFLHNYRGCTVKNFSRNIKDSDGDHRAIDKLELELTPVERGKPIERLEFFNSEGNKLHSNELLATEKWRDIINKRVNTRSQIATH
jgi:hypothetical protein